MNARTTAAASVLVCAACASAPRLAPTEPEMAARAAEVLPGWSESSRLAARAMIERYGAPDEVGASRLIWHGNGPWKRTIVRDLPRPYSGAPGEDHGIIEQTVAYALTPETAAELAPLGDRLFCDPSRGEMSSRADREEVNFLRLNLANDVARRVITTREASESFARILALESSGKTIRYMLSLGFGRRP